MIRVKVPATSANLGVGFDCMGLALDWQGVFTFCFDGPEFMISGCPKAYQNKDNLVYHAFARTLMALGKRVPVVQIHIDTPIPVARGLGSSASCIVAGVLGAVAYSGQKLPLQELLRLATLLEHHPDNVAPALYGSLCASFMENGMPYTAQFAVHEKFRFVTIIPDYEVRTEDARRILPSDMSYADAIYQMGRCATLGKALESGDEEISCTVPAAQKKTVVVISADHMGEGDDELGRILLKGFLFALTQQEKLPSTLLFYNGGARVTCEGSPSLEDLKNLAALGVEILTCGTCLSHYGLTDRLQVGGVTNMYVITEKQMQADLVLRP